MAKNLFTGLVKISGDNWTSYGEAKTTGKLIFADITSEGHVGKYIYANGIEYKVADTTDLDELIQRVSRLESSMGTLEAWKVVVDTSITGLDASVKNHEGRIATTETSTNTLETWRAHIDDVSVDKLDTSVKNHETRIKALEDADDVLAGRITEVSTHANNNDASIVVLKAKDQEIDGSIGDISTRLSQISIAAADNKLTVNGTNVDVIGNGYVLATAADNDVSISLDSTKIQDGDAQTEGHDKLATKGYVDEQMGELTQALVFKGSVDDNNPLPTSGQKVGDTYVAASDMTTPKADAGDLFIWNGSNWTRVERNLDGAVTSAEGLSDGTLIIGKDGQTIGISSVTESALTTAIANANLALQNVTASTLSDFVTVAAVKDASAVNVSVGVTTHDVSTAASNANGLATALGAKEYVDAKAAEITVSATLNSSTSDYIDAAAVVDAAGRVISASVGAKVISLNDASAGAHGLADANNVYTELTAVEEVIAAANASIATATGLDGNFGPGWSATSGINNSSSHREVIEELYSQVGGNVVNSIGGVSGEITLDTTTTAGQVTFTMSGDELQGSVTGWSDLEGRVTANEGKITDSSNRLNDLSTYVRTTVDTSIKALETKVTDIDASIDRLDASVSALETWKNNNSFVNTVEGETVVAGANTTFVYVNANPNVGDVALTSGVVLATNSYGTTSATGLATDAYVQDFLAWEVIGGE